MISKISRLAALALFGLALAAAPSANAAVATLCAPSIQSGAKRIVNPVTGNVYTSNPRGCIIAAQADIGWFQSQGWSSNGPSITPPIIYVTGALPASGTADIPLPALPANAYIQQIIIQNTTANAVTGNVSIGTTANGTDVVASQAVGANALVFVTDATLLKRVFSTTTATVLHAAPITSSNTANLTITIVFGYF